MIVLLSLPAWLMFLTTLLIVLWIGPLGGYFFQTVDHVARRRSGLPFSSQTMFTWDIFAGSLKALWLAALALGPVLYARYYWPDAWVLHAALLTLSATIAPASLLANVVTGSGVNMLSPAAWYQVIERAPEAYARLAAQVVATVVVWMAFAALIGWLLAPLGLVSHVILPFIHTAFTLWSALLFGRFLQKNGAEYGLMY